MFTLTATLKNANRSIERVIKTLIDDLSDIDQISDKDDIETIVSKTNNIVL